MSCKDQTRQLIQLTMTSKVAPQVTFEGVEELQHYISDLREELAQCNSLTRAQAVIRLLADQVLGADSLLEIAENPAALVPNLPEQDRTDLAMFAACRAAAAPWAAYNYFKASPEYKHNLFMAYGKQVASKFATFDDYKAYLVQGNAALWTDRNIYDVAAYYYLNGKMPDTVQWIYYTDKENFSAREMEWLQYHIFDGNKGYDVDDPAVVGLINRHVFFSYRTPVDKMEAAGYVYRKTKSKWERRPKTAAEKKRELDLNRDLGVAPEDWQAIISNPDYYGSMAVTGEKVQIVDRKTKMPLCGTNSVYNANDWGENYTPLDGMEAKGYMCESCVKIAVGRLKKA